MILGQLRRKLERIEDEIVQDFANGCDVDLKLDEMMELKRAIWDMTDAHVYRGPHHLKS